jgi:hypothetical protein
MGRAEFVLQHLSPRVYINSELASAVGATGMMNVPARNESGAKTFVLQIKSRRGDALAIMNWMPSRRNSNPISHRRDLLLASRRASRNFMTLRLAGQTFLPSRRP